MSCGRDSFLEEAGQRQDGMPRRVRSKGSFSRKKQQHVYNSYTFVAIMYKRKRKGITVWREADGRNGKIKVFCGSSLLTNLSSPP